MHSPSRPLICLALLACAAIAPVQASEQDAARHRIGVPKLQGRADNRAEEVESPMLPRVRDGLKETQALLGKIRGTEDPAQRRKLMQEHLQALNANLAQLRSLMSDDLSPRQVNQRVDLMQAMLDQMTERQRLEEEPAK